MKEYVLEASKATPSINFNFKKGVFIIKGRLIPEDAIAYFNPIQAALEDYLKNPLPQNLFTIQLDYLNSSSISCILNILKIFEKHKNKTSTEVNWCFEKGDEDLELIGTNFSEVVSLKFNFLQIKE
jgi:hypothetical protein